MIGAIIVGALAGWLAGVLTKGEGYGILINILLGIIGGVIGGWVFRFFGFTPGTGFVPQLITALVGAAIVLYIFKALKK